MPRIPVYQERQLYQRSEVGPQRSSRVLVGEPPKLQFWESVTRGGQALTRASLIANAAYEKRKDEQDTIDVHNARNKFSDAERTFLTGELTTEGEQARGSMARGSLWYGETISKYKDTLKNDDQKQLFGQIISAQRATGLDRLASHEAQQHSKLQALTLDASLKNAESEVRLWANDPDRREHAIRMAEATFHDFYGDKLPKEVYDEMWAQQEGALRTATIESLVELDPHLGRELIKQDAWRQALGENYPRLKAALDQATQESYLDAAYQNARLQFGSNIEAAIQEVTKPAYMKRFGLSREDANYLEKVLKKEREQQLETIQNDYLTRLDTLTESEVIANQFLPPTGEGSKNWFIDKIKKRQDSVGDVFNQFDPAYRAELLRKIALEPETVDARKDIYFRVGEGKKRGLTPDQAETLNKKLQDALKNKDSNERLGQAHKILDRLRSAEMFTDPDEPDPVENELQYQKTVDALESYVEKNPTEDPIKWIEDNVKAPVEQNWILRILNSYVTSPFAEIEAGIAAETGDRRPDLTDSGQELRKKAGLPAKFNPEGNDYDYKTATEIGRPDETGHWFSLDPRTGMVLKGRKHETFWKTIEVEERLGNKIVKGDDGRYYSAPTSDPRPAIKVKKPENASEKLDRDKRARAIQILQANGKLVNEDTIKIVMDQLPD